MTPVDHVPKRHAKILSARAARALHVARELAGADGEVQGGQRALAKALGITDLSAIRKAMIELEEHRLARRVGVLRVLVGGVPERHVVDEQPVQIGSGARGGSGARRSKDPAWREERARNGGLKRALKEKTERVDELERALVAATGPRIDADPNVVALRRDALHAAHCCVVGCVVCFAIATRLEDERPRYLTAAELGEQLDAAAITREAAKALLGAMRSRLPGAKAAAAAAFLVIELTERGEVSGARAALRRLQVP